MKMLSAIIITTTLVLGMISEGGNCLTLRSKRDAFRFPEEDEAALSNSSSSSSGQNHPVGPRSAQSQSVVQLVRLREGIGINTGYVEVLSGQEWHLLCDDDDAAAATGKRRFDLPEGNVLCRQIGYGGGAVHTAHGNDTLGNISAAIKSSSAKFVTMSLNCRGDERSVGQCQVTASTSSAAATCDPMTSLVSVACARTSFALCPVDQDPFGNSCYELRREPPLAFAAAQSACGGGHLLEIDSNAEKGFIDEWLRRKGASATAVLTGGITTNVAGKDFHLWHHSQKQVTLAVSMKHSPSAGAPQALGLRKDGEEFSWVPVNMDHPSAFICESPQLDIGCISGSGADYNGSASRGEGGKKCLPWNTPGLQEIFPGQSAWEHSQCRNPDGLEESPICFTDENEYDSCAVPQCTEKEEEDQGSEFGQLVQCRPHEHPPRPDVSDSESNSNNNNNNNHGGSCGKERFQCQPGECIFASSVCDGEPDCLDGQDEKECVVYTSFFDVEQGFRLQQGKGEETVTDGTAEDCAKRCLQSKHCTCTSFSHNPEKNRCLMGNRYSSASPYDAVLERKSWNYFKLNGSVDNGCNRVKRPASTPFEGIRLLSKREADVVEVKINGSWGGICDDGFSFNEAHVVCRQLGFELGAEQVINGQGSPADPINVYDMECEGDERHISECRFGDHNAHRSHACAGTEKAGLRCRRTSRTCEEHEWHCRDKECVHINDLCDGVPQCKDASDEEQESCAAPLQVRLADGELGSTGRLEVRHNGVWGSVCDDNFGEREAQVVCTMMGFGNTVGKVYNGTADFRGTGPVWVRFATGEGCKGTESSLEQCKAKHLWQHDHHCNHDEDVAISCTPVTDELAAGTREPVLSASPIDTHANLHSESADDDADLYHSDSSDVCGEIKVEVPPEDAVPRITAVASLLLGGATARAGIHPWQATIRVRGMDKTYHWCGAVIVSHFDVLTAAHCLREFPQSTYIVRVGDWALDVKEASEAEYEIEKIEYHENYNVGPYLNNDLAIVRIKTAPGGPGILFGPKVSQICLPSSDFIYGSHMNVTITGWGKVGYEGGEGDLKVTGSNDRTQGVNHLQEAVVPIIPRKDCEDDKVYGTARLSPGMFCAGNLEGGGPDACQGDSGGPAVADVGGRKILLGITSWGYGCGRRNKPGVYTKVANYVSWIRSKMARQRRR